MTNFAKKYFEVDEIGSCKDIGITAKAVTPLLELECQVQLMNAIDPWSKVFE